MGTVTYMNLVHDDMNFMVKYMIWGEVNITIDIENFMNNVNGDCYLHELGA